jgi:PST family polysaccharide transporter
LTLKEQVLRGAAVLVLRQGVGVGLSFVGGLLLTRLIGPEAFGLYAAALGIVVFLSLVARAGADVHLLRRDEAPTVAMYHQAFSFFLLSAIGLGALGVVAAPALGYWLNDDRYLAPVRVLLLALPLTVVSVPAVARLERALDYRSVAVLELVQQLLFLIVGLVLAWQGLGVWAAVAGYGVSQAWLVVASHALAAALGGTGPRSCCGRCSATGWATRPRRGCGSSGIW